MDDLQFGSRDKRGNWTPNALAEPAPIWHRPFSLRKVQIAEPRQFHPLDLCHGSALDRGRDRASLGLCEHLGHLAAVDDTLALAELRHPDRARRARGLLFLSAPGDPLAASLQAHPLGPSQLDQPEPLVVAFHAPA